MITTDLINMLKEVEFGASGRPREISFQICNSECDSGEFAPRPNIQIDSTGDGMLGAEVCLRLTKDESWDNGKPLTLHEMRGMKLGTLVYCEDVNVCGRLIPSRQGMVMFSYRIPGEEGTVDVRKVNLYRRPPIGCKVCRKDCIQPDDSK